MKLTNLFMIVPLSLFSVGAFAAMSEVEGNTVCTNLLSVSEKTTETYDCYYSGSVGTSNAYAITELDLLLGNADNWSVVDNVWIDNTNKKSSTKKKTVTTINGVNAKIIHLNNKTFKTVSQKEFNKRLEKDSANFDDVLKCYVADDEGVCVPYNLSMELGE